MTEENKPVEIVVENDFRYGGFKTVAEIIRPGRQIDDPKIIVEQNEGGDIRISIYNVRGGVMARSCNGGVDERERKRHQRWYRNFYTSRPHGGDVIVRYLTRGDADNLKLET